MGRGSLGPRAQLLAQLSKGRVSLLADVFVERAFANHYDYREGARGVLTLSAGWDVRSWLELGLGATLDVSEKARHGATVERRSGGWGLCVVPALSGKLTQSTSWNLRTEIPAVEALNGSSHSGFDIRWGSPPGFPDLTFP